MAGARRDLWGWSVPVRVLLAGVSTILGLFLWIGAPGRATVAPPDPTLVIDPNTARTDVLSALPRLGPVLVGRIAEARRERPFRSMDDLDARVRGIGPVTAAAIRPYFVFPGAGSGPAGAPAAGPAAPRP